ncbi:MAG: hypothetical protein BWY44_01470 [Candidatus Omnitrophica bacterium ADurb.Bin292]|nr:MAG: hypothetical protein BWY44_01470 [Candidatus Omnitrophica bacterium ADurb.Bin292]HQB12370.1 hypothetical protein [Candidatus Omnitrophota bacterium]
MKGAISSEELKKKLTALRTKIGVAKKNILSVSFLDGDGVMLSSKGISIQVEAMVRSEGSFLVNFCVFFDLIKTYIKRDLSFYSQDQKIWMESTGSKIQLPFASLVDDPMQMEKIRLERKNAVMLKKKRKAAAVLQTGQKVFYLNDEKVICDGIYIQPYGREVRGYTSRQVFVQSPNGEAIVIDREKIFGKRPSAFENPLKRGIL